MLSADHVQTYAFAVARLLHTPPSCRLRTWKIDGTYTIGPEVDSPDSAERVFCDMANGGWSLVAMSHTCSYRVTTPVNEPTDFFVAGFNSESNLLEARPWAWVLSNPVSA